MQTKPRNHLAFWCQASEEWIKITPGNGPEMSLSLDPLPTLFDWSQPLNSTNVKTHLSLICLMKNDHGVIGTLTLGVHPAYLNSMILPRQSCMLKSHAWLLMAHDSHCSCAWWYGIPSGLIDRQCKVTAEKVFIGNQGPSTSGIALLLCTIKWHRRLSILALKLMENGFLNLTLEWLWKHRKRRSLSLGF
eukprot:818436-Pelagomonas_calceolata.AAC.3